MASNGTPWVSRCSVTCVITPPPHLAGEPIITPIRPPTHGSYGLPSWPGGLACAGGHHRKDGRPGEEAANARAGPEGPCHRIRGIPGHGRASRVLRALIAGPSHLPGG